MLQSIKLFATYNASTNEKVHDLLLGLEPSLYSQERNTYFKSIQGLHLHIILVSKLLQSLIRTNSDGKYFVSPYTKEAFEVKPLTLDESSKLLSTYDKNLLEFSEQLDEKDVTHPKTKCTMGSGRTFLLSISDLMTHYMVHTVHHRGQLSQILDELGIEHDIGSTLAFAEEVKE